MTGLFTPKANPQPRTRAGCVTRWLGSCLLGILLFPCAPAQAQTATEAWVRRYNSGEPGARDYANKVIADADGNIVVAGYTDDGFTGQDILIIKYSGAGVALWTNRYNGPDNFDDQATAIAVDTNRTIVATGFSVGSGTGPDYVTIAYSSAGVPLWTNRYNRLTVTADRAYAVAVDRNRNVFVTGSGGGDYVTIAYSEAGLSLWTNRYNGPANNIDEAAALAVDRSGNVFVSGRSMGLGTGHDYATIAYSGAGVALWTNRYGGLTNSSAEYAYALAVDDSGNVFVTGSSSGTGGHFDYLTIAYSGAGVPLWTNRYNGPTGGADEASAVTVDMAGNVFVTGHSIGSEGARDYATVAYSGAGLPLWTNRYNGSGNYHDFATAIAVDSSGNVFVSGRSGSFGPFFDYVTIAYSTAGVPLWTNRYNGPGNLDDYSNGLAVDGSGGVFVTGHSFGSRSGPDFATIAYSGAGLPLWTNRYNGRGNRDDRASALAVDNTGTVFVTGYTVGVEGSFDYATIAYSSAGLPLWINHYNGPENGSDEAKAMAVDSAGNVFVTGRSFSAENVSGYATIAYSAAGVALWTNRHSGSDIFDSAGAVAVDNTGHVYVTGFLAGDYATISYSVAGVPLWTNRYNGSANGRDSAVAIAAQDTGTVFVTGSSAETPDSYFYFDYVTIAYSAAGAPLWTNRYTGSETSSDGASALAVDRNGNVFVTGSSASPFDYDYATIAYSGAGLPLWTNRYNGPGNGDDTAFAVAVDSSGNVFVTGDSRGRAGDFDYATIAYSGAGVPLWTNRYDGPGNAYDHAYAIAVDASGNVFVTGVSLSDGNSDYVTMAYSSAGVPLWTQRYNGLANGSDVPETRFCVAIGPDGAVYVTGSSDGNYGGEAIYDFATIKYVWRPHLTIQPLTASSSTVNLTLSGPANSSWSIERALRIAGPWTNLGPSQIPANGLGLFQDANPLPKGAFYRAAQP